MGMIETVRVLLANVRDRVVGLYRSGRLFPRLIKMSLLAVGGILIACLLFFILVWAGLFGKIPGRDALRSISHPVASEVYSADSVLLGRYFLQERSTVPSSQIPETLKNALIATEDVRFHKHHGVDTRSLLRVLVKGILFQQGSAGGGSTLTQQLAKNLFPRESYLFLSLPINKAKEVIIARRLESIYSKDEIITLYLNTIPFGDNVYGIKTAAERFFSVPVEKLTLDQSAVLIGMLKATHRYNPRLFPDRAKQRRDVVLAQLHKYEFISAEEKQTLQSMPLNLRYKRTNHNSGAAPYFRAYIKSEMLAWCRTHDKPDGTPYNLYTDGLKIYTTIDSRLQLYAEQSMRSEMAKLQDKFKRESDKAVLRKVASAKITTLPVYRRLKEAGHSQEEIMEELKKPGIRKVFTWKGTEEKQISVYDSLVHHLQFLQTGILALDPGTGEVKAWVGGIDHEFFQFDHVRESTKRQVGSTFKPIVYAAALEQGVDPCDYTSGRKTSYTNMKDWTPENGEDDTYDQKFSMEGGLAGSVNTVSVKLLERAGISNVIEVADRMGIKSNLPAVPSLALGTASISMTEMVAAYSVFANNGKAVSPWSVTSITNSRGEVLERFESEQEADRVLSEATSDMMIHMLKRVVNDGTGAGLRSRFGIMNDMAGKTGTTQANADGWFIGVTPHLVIGCWVGADDPLIHFKSTASGQGAATALPIVARFFQKVNKDKQLNRISTARFDPLSANLLDKLDCDLSRSDRNLFQRIFNRKKGVKQTEFKAGKKRN